MYDLKKSKCLLPNTKTLLLRMIDDCIFLDKYTLVGGSALSLHLGHRKSEDLDFFTYEDSFDKQEIFAYIKNFEKKQVLNQTDTQIDLLLNGVKVTFFNAKWAFLTPVKKQKFNLSSLEDIAIMKINVLFLRAKYRDYYDIYFLLKNGISLRQMFESSLSVLDGINFKIFATALIYTDDVEDDNINHLEPVKILSKEAIRNFFQLELEKYR